MNTMSTTSIAKPEQNAKAFLEKLAKARETKEASSSSERKSTPGSGKKGKSPNSQKETLSALADRNPVLKRYLDFTRNLLSVCQLTESEPAGLMSPGANQRLAEAVRTFYYAECAKSSTHSALPLQGKRTEKAQTKVNVPLSNEPGEVRTAEGQKAAQKYVPLRTRVTRFANDNGEFVAISGKLASAMTKEQEIERSMLWERIPKKHRKALERSDKAASGDEEYLKTKTDSLKDAIELADQYDLGADRTQWSAKLAAKNLLLGRVNVVDFRTYAGLKKAGRLAESDHAVAFLRALTSIVENIPREYKLSEDFPNNLAATKAQMQQAVNTLPIWPKVRNWGRYHPKVLLLQSILGRDHDILGYVEALSSLEVMQTVGGPLALSAPKEEEKAPQPEKILEAMTNLLPTGGIAQMATAAVTAASPDRTAPVKSPAPPPAIPVPVLRRPVRTVRDSIDRSPIR